MVKRTATWLVGVAALFSGAALLGSIVFGASLPLGLVVVGGAALVTVVLVVRRLPAHERRRLRAVAIAGVAAGVVATLCYDAAKTVLSQADPSPFNPFEATRAFGILLLGEDADARAVQVAGVSVHLLNGTAFGVAFTVLFARDGALSRWRALLYGVGWGLFLELFQLALYPGWLDIRAFGEFATITALSHIVYGATLGLIGRSLLRRLVRGATGASPDAVATRT